MIYIVEDDAAIRELEQYALQSSGYEVQSFETSEPFWQAMRTAEPELVILDVMLPGEDGFSILKKLRNTPALRRLPIIMVTAKSSELDTVRGLDCGADDYITKPFGIMEFLSRVRAALRRSAPEEKQNVYAFHEILLDNARHSVTVNGTHIDLTYKEYSLLRLLLENTNLVVTRETILQVVWGTDISVESRTVDMHIRTHDGEDRLQHEAVTEHGQWNCRKHGYQGNQNHPNHLPAANTAVTESNTLHHSDFSLFTYDEQLFHQECNQHNNSTEHSSHRNQKLTQRFLNTADIAIDNFLSRIPFIIRKLLLQGILQLRLTLVCLHVDIDIPILKHVHLT